MTSICLHKGWMEGGSLPRGRWCQQCGARVDTRGSKVDQALSRKEREQRLARQYTKTQFELLGRSRAR